jgi:uncharacterized tellurite resistance protein B-like protein
MLFRWLKADAPSADERPQATEELKALVAQVMPEATPESAAIVAAVAGLLAFVAHADRAYEMGERAAVEQAIARIEGLSAAAAQAISGLLAARIADLATEPLQTYTRVLGDLTTRTARIELLDVLMDVAAADDILSMDETHGLRRVAKLLGLSEADYMAAQAGHRERLSVLRKDP